MYSSSSGKTDKITPAITTGTFTPYPEAVPEIR